MQDAQIGLSDMVLSTTLESNKSLPQNNMELALGFLVFAPS